MKTRFRTIAWQVLRRWHQMDFAFVLPSLARMPIAIGYWLAQWRGRLNARLQVDWRSMALGYRHVAKQSRIGFEELRAFATAHPVSAWLRERFIAEAQDEYDAQLIATGQFPKLRCAIEPPMALESILQAPRGILLLTLHYDSFYLGSLFLAQAGRTVNIMSSSVTHHPLVDPAVQAHFSQKYRGSEPYLHGGKVLDMEEGLRPFYRMLERREVLMMLADAPILPNGAGVEVSFLEKKRLLAGGALRLALKTNSLMAAYLCKCIGPGQYRMELLAPQEPSLQTLNAIYQFLGDAILHDPGRWWAVDLLPQMPVVPLETQR